MNFSRPPYVKNKWNAQLFSRCSHSLHYFPAFARTCIPSGKTSFFVMATLQKCAKKMEDEPPQQQLDATVFTCPQCANMWKRSSIKLVACPRELCSTTPLDPNRTKYSCAKHGDLLATVIKIETYKCPSADCTNSLRRLCTKCMQWKSASNFSKRMKIINFWNNDVFF